MNNLDVLFISAPSPHATAIVSHRMQGLPPLGLGYIATWVNNHGYKSEILDMNIASISLKDLKEYLEASHVTLIGLSTTTETYKNGLRIAEYIKKFDNSITVFMGGSHVTYEYKDALKSSYVDIVVRNEGEITAKELCDYYVHNIGTLDKIDGISYIVNGKIVSNRDRAFIANLDDLPYPDRTLFNLNDYPVPASISSSRGCPGRCIFCAASGLSGGKYRTRSAKSIIGEFKYLKGLGFNHVQIVDDTMTASIKRLNEFLDIMIAEELKMTWNCESRVDIVSYELLKRMKKAGCRNVQFGVEAGSQKMLDSLKKNITMEQIYNVFTWCKELGLGTASCLIIGQPFDTLESVNESIRLASELQQLGARIVFSVSTPYPGTYMYENPDKLGLEIIDFDFDNYTTLTPVYNSQHLNADQIQACYFDAYMALSKAGGPPEVAQYWNMVKQRGNEIMQSAY